MYHSRKIMRNQFLQTSLRSISFFNKEIVFSDAMEGLKLCYQDKLLPLEEETYFHRFQSSKLHDGDFIAKPIILFMGQYSTGKTTFIRHLLKTDFPGMRIGPEPTTDRFIALMHGDREAEIPGNALVVDKTKPFGPLARYGNAFLTKFQCSTIPSKLLEGITVIDTPGILSGEKQRVDRGYDFTGVLEWFAARVDRVFLLFDANKLDISDEFRNAIQSVKGNEEKIRIVLNKADAVDTRSLLRVYGSLMWSLSRVIKTPEVSQVFIGSYWENPLNFDDLRDLFEKEEKSLIKEIDNLPVDALLRKLNDFGKRTRLVYVHALIMDSIMDEMPHLFGRDKKRVEIIKNLDKLYEEIQIKNDITPGDFPPIEDLKQKLEKFDFSKLRRPKKRSLQDAQELMNTDLPKLMALIPQHPSSLKGLVYIPKPNTIFYLFPKYF